ncbi:hypothetical protein INR49_021364 [Caranx melampygus]|nr:hypothetical protein INR49_021364 [Caranx melampygus]
MGELYLLKSCCCILSLPGHKKEEEEEEAAAMTSSYAFLVRCHFSDNPMTSPVKSTPAPNGLKLRPVMEEPLHGVPHALCTLCFPESETVMAALQPVIDECMRLPAPEIFDKIGG